MDLEEVTGYKAVGDGGKTAVQGGAAAERLNG